MKKYGYKIGAYKNTFCWPSKIANNGPFWTHNHNEKEMKRVLNFVLKANNKVWTNCLKKINNKLIFYNRNNRIFFNYLNKIKFPFLELNK